MPLVVIVLAAGALSAMMVTRGLPAELDGRIANLDSGPSGGGAGQDGIGTGVTTPATPSPSPSSASASASAPPGASSAPSVPASAAPSLSASVLASPAAGGRVNTAGVNLALRKTVTTSGTEAGAWPASAAVDGDITTRWSSAFADPGWITVDLGAVWQVSDVRLAWEHAYAVKYRVDLSLDAKHWTTVYRTTAGANDTRDISVKRVAARYVRMYGTQRSSVYGYSLLEFEVR